MLRQRILRLAGCAIALELLIVPISPSLAQEAEPAEPVPTEPTEPAAEAPSDGLYFADVLVRGQPVFQVGSLSDLSARERADIINRRLAGVLANAEAGDRVTIERDSARNLVTLQFNNRVLMTVTDQDAQDFGASVDELAERWTERLNQTIDKPPLAIDVVQRLNGTLRQLGRNTIDHIPALVGAFVVLIVTWLIAKGVRYAAFRWAQQTEGDHNTEVLVGRLGYGGIWILGTVVALGVLGLDFGALLGALGLTSVAIGFSLKDVLSNYISGVILLAARPFRIGDQVVIEDYEGTITQVQLRATTMTTYDGSVVYIPNQEVFQASVINHTASALRRSAVMVGIDYDADIAKAQRVIEQAVFQAKGIQPEPRPEVLVRELAASTVNLEARFWVKSRKADFLEATSIVTRAIKEALETADIEMPTEIYTLAFRNAPISLPGGGSSKITLTAEAGEE